ncbi:AI-2E family transporter [Methylopila turkensis]|uniref:AI-2E family transporter n=1 Tax=Methylopila turkensis TaxID=1437816 RepID=A0A9W6JQM5_9HYPH|nr:AI-2E family transporter [Methylopila turkensis]GLK80766.1 AI-2E family transporter [Methylopila turkensis]
MALQRQVLFWIGLAAVVVLFLYLFSSILLPFVAGLALAYLLDPLADRLGRLGLPRVWATVVILVTVVLTFVLLIMLIAPLLAEQLANFVERLPQTIARLQELIAQQNQPWIERLLGQGLGQVRSSIGTIVSQGLNWMTTFLASLWTGGQAVLSVISLLVVTPVVAFYMLIDWDRMVETIDGWVPLRHKATIRRLARDIDGGVAGFVRGQALVCLLLGTFYAIALSMVGLNFGLLIGLGAGLIGFIPYIGSITGLLVSLAVAIVQFWPDYTMVAIVLGIFVFGQFVEGNFLQPRLVGRSVGLHPVWLMFALVAFGYLFGFVGLLVAVPLAAAVGVLLRFGLDRYLESPFYTGDEGEPDVLPGGPKGASLFGPRTTIAPPPPPAAPPAEGR